jgi:hypothetical protein
MRSGSGKHEPVCLQNRFLPDSFDSLEIVMASLNLMESTLLGVRRVRQYVGAGIATKMLDLLIQEGDSQVSAIKRKVAN